MNLSAVNEKENIQLNLLIFKLHFITYSGGASRGDRPQTSTTPEALISSRAFLRLKHYHETNL